jgi:membrane protein
MAGSSWTEKPRVLALRRRWPLAEKAAVTIDGYRLHRSGRNATIVAHFGFLSIFPLLLVATTILGFVLQNRPKLRDTIIDSALSQLPFVGQTISSDPSQLQGSVAVLVLGLGAALWAGMKAFVALQGAFDDVAEVPLDDRLNLFKSRLRALLGILIVGVSQVVTAGLTTLVGATRLFGIGKALLLVAAVAVNIAVLAASFRWLCSATRPWRAVLPGAIVGGVLFSGLQLIGTVVVGRAVANAAPVYGTFATVIGLFTWFGLHSSVAMWCAEVNQTLHPHRPPDAC